ncbi:type 2 periplasmic-binding domain-containing protein [Parenemella sanctibonifatiensis]|uniref:Extracellular solute-binding protein n=1 Tax=Parenemella sanctibonifatiensis TaxID=2016505 RepID=A0A255ERB2_9ACTN|nr:extracellular solute-binding protein [Parenemella sanctibonifatiensis]OYN91992.1 hypothetical protein CGZ91_00195 [Parenemella sanctibonifatiensis]
MGITSSISRRQILGGAAGLGLAATGVAACSTDADPGAGGGNAGGGGAQSTDDSLPTYTPYGNVEPDLPGDPEQGVPAAYYHFPEITDMPGIPLPQTEPFSYLAEGSVAQTPRPGNRWYEQFATDMGNQFEIIIGGYAEYRDKFAVTLAGNDLPDLMMIMPVPQMESMMESKFHDLTPYLSGDNVQEYPSLAALPSAVWKVSSLNGRLWGVTRPTVAISSQINVWSDDMESIGLAADPEPANGEELLDMFKEMTGGGKFALGADPVITLLNPALQMCGAPNGWTVSDDGTFTHAYETEAYSQALEVSAEMFAAGILHPDSISNPDGKSGWYREGVTRAFYQGFSAWGYTTVNHKGRRQSYIRLPKWDGGGAAPHYRAGGGYPEFTAISKAVSEDRVRELLQIFNYIAAPFGTRQYLTGEYGVEGVHYDLDGTDPVIRSEPRTADMIGGLGYAGRTSLFDIYIPGYDDVATRMHEYVSEFLPTAIPDASLGLFSEAWTSERAKFTSRIKDLHTSIIRGLESPDAWASFVSKEWTPAVGDPSREQFQEAAAAQA